MSHTYVHAYSLICTLSR